MALAGGSLPPAFPTTAIKDGKTEKFYWDGGLFDNTPLGAVLDKLDRRPEVSRTIYVISLFPNKAPPPRDLVQVAARMKDLQFANKTREDVKLLERFNKVAKLVEALENLSGSASNTDGVLFPHQNFADARTIFARLVLISAVCHLTSLFSIEGFNHSHSLEGR